MPSEGLDSVGDPYVLRAYFDTQLMLAESKGLVLEDYRSFGWVRRAILKIGILRISVGCRVML